MLALHYLVSDIAQIFIAQAYGSSLCMSLGKRTTSLMFSILSNVFVILSIPSAKPPCGGTPYLKNLVNHSKLFSDILSISYDEFVALLPEFSITAKHRFFVEDVPIGLVLLSSLGDMVGVNTPTIDSIIHLVEIINEADYNKQGRTVEKLGISGMNVESLDIFLAEGKQPK